MAKETPLKEIVFEIKLKDAQLVDYDIFVGELFSKLKSSYSFYQALKPSEFPALLMPFVIQHRFRKIENGYPLYQLGPGIASFNMDGLTFDGQAANKWGNYKTDLLHFLTEYKNILSGKFSPKILNI